LHEDPLIYSMYLVIAIILVCIETEER
jgi:hypothetical protein